jgi:hypothetical protein
VGGGVGLEAALADALEEWVADDLDEPDDSHHSQRHREVGEEGVPRAPPLPSAAEKPVGGG